jgi:hypothetical protein
VFLIGCGSTGVGNPGISQKDQALVDDGTSALDAGDTASSLNSLTTLALRDPALFVDDQTVATLVQERTPLYFEPAGCLVTSRDAATVTFSFDGCRTGAFGLIELSGEMVATYAVDDSSVGISLGTRPEIELGATRIILESENLLTLSGSSSTLVGNGRYQATRTQRPDIDHASTYLATYESNTQCLHLDGTATTLFDDGRGVETSLSDYLRCGPRGTCPTSGELVLTRLPDRDRTLTLEFDDDSTAWVPELETDVALGCRE